MGIYQSTVTEQYFPYARPQETGNKEDVRWAFVSDYTGAGLLVVAESPMRVSALHYTAADLEKADHINELQARPEIYLCLDYKQQGIGNGSCGPGPLEKYTLRPGSFSFSYSLRPCSSARQSPGEAGRERLPEVN